ncbi:VWA domain-containing protein, partial [bacterium]|nr:VWA domain-containing protein [bacterium]
EISWGWASLVLILLPILPLFIAFYRLENKPVPKSLKNLLLALRLLFVVGIILLISGPRLVVQGVVPQKSRLAVLIDTSRSMSISEAGKTRIEEVRQVLFNGQMLEKLEQKTGISPSLFSFADQVAPLSRDDISSFSLTPEGNFTNLTRAVSEVTGNLGASNLLGTIILTDGAHNQGDSPGDLLRNIRSPLFFLGVGHSGLTKDLRVSLERPPAMGFLNSMVRVRGEVGSHKIATETVTVEINKNGVHFDSLKVPIPKGGHRGAFSLNIPCDVEGAFTYTASVPKLKDELSIENNETSFLLKVVKDRLKIVVLSGSPEWDLTFLKGVVKSDPNANLSHWIKVIENRWLRSENFSLKPPVENPDFKPDLLEADVLVLSGVAERFLSSCGEIIQKRVESGKLGVLIFPCKEGYSKLGFIKSSLE